MGKEKEQQKMKQVRVGFYGRDDREVLEKTQRVREFLLQYGGSCRMEFGGVDKPGAEVKVELAATIPEEYAGRHHGFDSKLNSTGEGGLGVGWVEEAD